jgi:hypothetical protein
MGRRDCCAACQVGKAALPRKMPHAALSAALLEFMNDWARLSALTLRCG